VAGKITNNLGKLMKQHGYTVESLAVRVAAHPSNVYVWLQGRHMPRTDYLLSLCSLFKCQISDIWHVEHRSELELGKLSDAAYEAALAKVNKKFGRG